MIKQKIIDFMATRPDEVVFLRSEFTEALPACSRAGIDRAIKQMVEKGVLFASDTALWRDARAG